MAKTRRNSGKPRAGRRRLAVAVLAFAAGVGLLGFAYAQSGAAPSFSLNSPVSFPVDI